MDDQEKVEMLVSSLMDGIKQDPNLSAGLWDLSCAWGMLEDDQKKKMIDNNPCLSCLTILADMIECPY